MTIKKGDLVVIVGSENPDGIPFIGSIRTAGEPSPIHLGDWLLIPTISVRGYDSFSWNERHLLRIDPPSSGELKGVPIRIKEPV